MKLEAFLPHLLVELPGVSDPLVKQTLLRLAIDFCQRSQCWQEVVETIALANNQAEYDLDPPTDAQIYLLLDAWIGTRQLTPLTVQRQQLNFQADQNSSYPTHYRISADRQSLTLYPTPAAVTATPGLQVKACYAPKPAATTLPDLLGDRYLLAVCAGVKAALMAIPGQAWSNPSLVPFYRAQFDDGVLAARMEVMYDASIGGQITVAPRTFGF